jgi:hypothetical protein
MKYFSVVNKFKIIKNPYENRDLLTDLKNFNRKPKVKTFVICDWQKEI